MKIHGANGEKNEFMIDGSAEQQREKTNENMAFDADTYFKKAKRNLYFAIASIYPSRLLQLFV